MPKFRVKCEDRGDLLPTPSPSKSQHKTNPQQGRLNPFEAM